MTKQQQLENVLAECASVCLGYSGGVDSVFLAVTSLDVLGASNVLCVTGRSASYPSVQWETARSVALQFGLPHLEIETDELRDANYLANPTNRCYFCKSELWSKLAQVARARRIAIIADGSNADDAKDYRPGTRAAREHGVRSPLMEVGLTKAEIRTLSRARGLPTWNQPSAPCLSSRVPYGLAITPERLRQIEAAEQVVRDAGIREFRVRHHGAVARLEVAPTEMNDALDAASALNEQLRSLGFSRVLLDAEGYRQGSLNEAPLVKLAKQRGFKPAVQALVAEADIAVIDVPLEALDDLKAAAAELRRAGYRYVAIDLANVPSRSRS